MYKILALVLLLGGIALGVMGLTTYQDATAGVSFLGLDLSLSDQEGKQTALLYMISAVACLYAGFRFYRKA